MRFFLRCISYFRGDVPRILWSLLLIFVAALVALLQPFPLAMLIDSVLLGKAGSSWQHRLFLWMLPAGMLGQILTLAALTLALVLLGGVLAMFQTMASVGVGYRGCTRVRCDLFRKLQHLSLSYHRAQPQGDSIYRLSQDAFAFQTILNVFVGNILVSGVMLAVMTWMMFSMDWRLALISLAVVPMLCGTHGWSQRTLRERWEVAKRADAGLTTDVQRAISAMWLTQAFGREDDEYARFRASVGGSVRAMMHVHWREVVYGLLVATILGLGTALIFGYGGYLVYHDQYVAHAGDAGMTVGKLYIFIAYLSKFYDPLNKLTGSGASMAQAAVGARRVFEVLDRAPDVAEAPDALAFPKAARTLELRDVSFAYRPDAPVLRGISATIAPGEMVAFVGSSGVGKSTILNLLPRFYDPTGGALLLDGTDIRRLKIADLRRHIALVLQDSVLLPTTIAENIAYGRPDATPEQVQAAARQAGAHEFILALPDGYATPVTENSTNLSGGQRQRVAIARALLTEAPIVILDEPTSALDPHNERMITQTLNTLKRTRTIIVVSHRLSTVAECDRIFVMDAGRIVEHGTHEELIAAQGLYHSMARHQLLVDEEEGAVAAAAAAADDPQG